ncbi:MAG: hypothetical protein U5K81_09325 [Trueperaceae bacterium]|nr:hypothetical protein [Trueperaceae bacterium]
MRRAQEGLAAWAPRLGVQVASVTVGSQVRHGATGAQVPEGTVSDAEDARRAAARIEADPPDLLLIQHATFATGDLLAPLLRAAPRVAVWATPEGAAGEGPLPFNALCGLQMTLSMLGVPEVDRGEAPVKWLYGDVHEDRFREAFATTLAALRGVRALSRARILAIGGTAPAFYALEERPDALSGVTVTPCELRDLFDRVEAVPEREARARATDWADRHALEVDDATLLRGARIERALAALGEEAGADALAVRCWPELPDACGAMACAGMGTRAGEGMPAACEGDVMGALSMLALQGVAAEAAILMDVSDLSEADDALLLWHCGNAPLAWADPEGPRPRLTTHFNRTDDGPIRDMALAPGPATALRLLSGGREALIASGRIRRLDRSGYDGVRGWWSDLAWHGASLSAERFLAEMLHQRVPHHLAAVAGACAPALAEMAGWLGIAPRTVQARPFPGALHGGGAPAPRGPA